MVRCVLAGIGFVNLPTDLTGCSWSPVGLVLFALEPAIPSHGLLTVGGRSHSWSVDSPCTASPVPFTPPSASRCRCWSAVVTAPGSGS